MEETVTERILHLTLEIIYLLTGERFPLVKSGDHMTITVPPCDFLKPERHNTEKILEVTKKMMELLTGEGGLVGEVMEDRWSLSSWDPPEEATPDERYPFCKEEPLEEPKALHNDFPPPTDLPQHVSVGMKEEPDSGQGEAVISPIMKGPEEERLLHTEVSMSGDLLHLHVVTHYTATQVKEELLVSDDGLLEEPDVPPQSPSALIPQEASMEGEVTDVVCYKWNVVDPKRKPGQILPKPGHKAVKGKRFSCTECGKCLRSNADLIQHKRVHSGEKPFQCSECGKLFSKQSTLTMHHRIHTGQKPYTCTECGKSCRGNAELIQHSRVHSGEKPFQCSECGKLFSQQSSLTMHHRIHTGQKLYSCSVCGKCFTSKSELTKHGRSHTGLKPYSCPECGKFFTCSSTLFRHKKIHTGEKQFVCSECGKSFLTRSEMVIHQRIHTGERPYTCSECGKCFVSSSDLAKHQRSHTGLKPHICPECGKSYVSSSVLTRHQKIHRAEKRFFCTECGMGFVRTGEFLSHIKAHGRPRTSSRTPKLNLVPRPASDFLQDSEIKACPTSKPTTGLGPPPGLPNKSLSHVKARSRPRTSSRTPK